LSEKLAALGQRIFFVIVILQAPERAAHVSRETKSIMGIGLTQQASLYDCRGDSRIARYGVHVGCLLNKPDTQKKHFRNADTKTQQQYKIVSHETLQNGDGRVIMTSHYTERS
jgi:hypothetical protein